MTGATHLGDATAQSAQGALTTAYAEVAGRAAGTRRADPVVRPWPPVCASPRHRSRRQSSATVTLEAAGIRTRPSSSRRQLFTVVSVVKSFRHCTAANIFWQGCPLTLNTNCSVSGNILA